MTRVIYRAALASFNSNCFTHFKCLYLLPLESDRAKPPLCFPPPQCYIAIHCSNLLSQPKSLPSTSIQSNGVLSAVIDLLHPVLHGVWRATDLEKMRFHIFSAPQIPTPSPKDINPLWTLEPCNWATKYTHMQKSIKFRKHGMSGMSELLPWLSVPRCSAIGRPRLTWSRKISSSWDLDLDMDCWSGHWPTDQFLHESLRSKQLWDL